ncbi:hypothetical protein BTUL_0182g00090 [Botrytis tulipae]|uniref:Uncharacterized protein n=1 Tax=Botrytis tulipae TaxID=87230 RepID=A0A4Z1EEC0_9HELO|nr:hypothetical protein BTUL_0182g00090 [Botrytis tulipae]
MSTMYPPQRLDLCGHKEFRALTQAKLLEEIVKGCKIDAAKKGLPRDESQRLGVKKKQSEEGHMRWVEHTRVLQDEFERLENDVEHYCNTFKDPIDISTAFEMKAVQLEEAIEQIWRNAARNEKNSDFISFSREDPANQASFAGLSRTTIPATPDSLVRDGIGLEVFLRNAKDMKERRPDLALGEEPGPAIMSYGAALDMFGVPAGPSPKPKPSLEGQMTQCAIATEGPEGSELSGPKTEHDMRQRDSYHPLSKPLLLPEDQWALFASNKFMGDTAILARQYAKLVIERDQEEARVRAEKQKMEKQKGKQKAQMDTQPDESLAAGPIVSRGPTKNGWPLVESLDFAGFTNWVRTCKAADKTFGRETLKLWNTARKRRRNDIIAQIKAWEAPKGFKDGSADHPDPKKYFPQDVSLDELDLKSMGIQLKR